MTLIPYIWFHLYVTLLYMILLYSVLFIHLNSSSLISSDIFVGGFNSSDVEK